MRKLRTFLSLLAATAMLGGGIGLCQPAQAAPEAHIMIGQELAPAAAVQTVDWGRWHHPRRCFWHHHRQFCR